MWEGRAGCMRRAAKVKGKKSHAWPRSSNANPALLSLLRRDLWYVRGRTFAHVFFLLLPRNQKKSAEAGIDHPALSSEPPPLSWVRLERCGCTLRLSSCRHRLSPPEQEAQRHSSLGTHYEILLCLPPPSSLLSSAPPASLFVSRQRIPFGIISAALAPLPKALSAADAEGRRPHRLRLLARIR